jgi:hypothetical protein
VIGFLRECCGSKKLPIVPLEPQKTRPDRYIFQWKERSLPQDLLNDALRFLLHGNLTAPDGSGIPLTSHLLRHAFATEMASLKVPIEVLGALLHQRDPYGHQVLLAADPYPGDGRSGDDLCGSH